MKARGMIRWGLLPALFALTLFLVPAGATAHDRRDLIGGKYQAVVGFLNEPAIEGQLNGIDLTITDMSKKDANGKGTPVEGLEKTLKAAVSFGGGGATKEIPLVARFSMPGRYTGTFMPTEAGAYTFHLFGTINDQTVDERFESGPGRFNDVEALASVQFPHPGSVPAHVQAELDAAQSRANNARLFGIAGLVLGILSLGTAGFALTRRTGNRETVEHDAPSTSKQA